MLLEQPIYLSEVRFYNTPIDPDAPEWEQVSYRFIFIRDYTLTPYDCITYSDSEGWGLKLSEELIPLVNDIDWFKR